MRIIFAFALALASSALAAPLSAAEPAQAPPATESATEAGKICTFVDLHEAFSIKAECAGLGDYSGHSQPHKRLWLAGPWGQLQIIEVPEPYRTVSLPEVMDELGRQWSKARSPEAGSATLDGAGPALYVTERKMRSTSCSWVFSFEGRNVIARAVSFGPQKAREANLRKIRDAFEATFAPR